MLENSFEIKVKLTNPSSKSKNVDATNPTDHFVFYLVI